jgi:hypothetical protein
MHYPLERNKFLHFDLFAKHAELVRRPGLAQFVVHVVALLHQPQDKCVVGIGAAWGIQLEDSYSLSTDRLRKNRMKNNLNED